MCSKTMNSGVSSFVVPSLDLQRTFDYTANINPQIDTILSSEAKQRDMNENNNNVLNMNEFQSLSL